jgi:hypothetical protein
MSKPCRNASPPTPLFAMRGGTHAGLAAIKQWRIEARRKYHHTVAPLGIAQRDGKTILKARLTGTFPGSPVTLEFSFVLKEWEDRVAGDSLSAYLQLEGKRALVTGRHQGRRRGRGCGASREKRTRKLVSELGNEGAGCWSWWRILAKYHPHRHDHITRHAFDTNLDQGHTI